MPVSGDIPGSSAMKPAMSDYIVAYCDVLGQREKLDLLKKSDGNQDASESQRLYEETYCAVLDLRTRVRAALQSSLHDAAQNTPNFRDHQTTRTPCHISFFSDCVAIALRYSDNNGRAPILDVWHLLTSLSIAMIRCIRRHTPLRGAIEVGRAFEWPDGGVYGPIMGDVYELESQVARYPRMIVGPELSLRIRDWAERVRQKDGYYLANKNWVKNCNEMVCGDRDGMSILDYLGSNSRYRCGSLPGIEDAVRIGLEFVNGECERLRDKRDSKKMSMYFLLRDYYSGRWAQFWNSSSETSGNVKSGASP